MICDDHRIVREALQAFVRSVPGVEIVTTAATGEEAIARFQTDQPDLVLMDIHMPGMGGLEATRRLVSMNPHAAVVMLTAADDRDQVAMAIANGARGYLHKDVSKEELCAAVAQALGGGDLVEPTMRRAMTDRPSSSAPAAKLTQREIEVLRGMSLGQSNAEIGRSLFLSEDTIKTHARRLFRKLEVNDRAQAVASGFRLGIVS